MFWKTSERLIPAMYMERARRFVHAAMSFAV